MASVERRPDTNTGPRWRVIWWQAGRREQATFADPGYARRFKALVETYDGWPPPTVWDRQHGCLVDDVPSDSPTFRDYAETTLHDRTRANEGTKKTYRAMLERHVHPELGDTPVDEILAKPFGIAELRQATSRLLS